MTDVGRSYVRASLDGWRATVRYARHGIAYSVCSRILDTRQQAEHWRLLALTALWNDQPDQIDGYHHCEQDGSGTEGFGYWAGPLHESEGGGHPGPPLVSRGRLVHGIDDGWSTVDTYTRRPIAGEW